MDLARRSRIRASAPTLEIEIGLARRVAPGDVATSAKGRVSRTRRLRAAVRNCTRDEGGPFGFGDQEPISSHRKLLRAKAVVVSVAKRRDKISAGTVERSERKSGPPISYSISTDGSWTRRWREMDSNFPYAVR